MRPLQRNQGYQIMKIQLNDRFQSRYLLLGLIIYACYIIILFIIAIPFIPEMFGENQNYEGFYLNPLIIFGAAAAIPLFIFFIILENKTFTTTIITLDKQILLYIILILLIQIGLNGGLLICVLLFVPDLSNC